VVGDSEGGRRRSALPGEGGVVKGGVATSATVHGVQVWRVQTIVRLGSAADVVNTDWDMGGDERIAR
jgi:hypothetical protein